MAKGRTVNVSRQDITALDEPRYLMEQDGKLYLTLAVLVYDPKHPEITAEQASAIKELQGQMEKGTKVRAVQFSGELTQSVINANMVGPGPIGASRGR